MSRLGQVQLSLIGITLLVIISCSTPAMAISAACLDCKPESHNQTSSASSGSIKWEVQLNTTEKYVYFQGVGMCKGTTDETRRAGFIASWFGIWRTLDGVDWKRVAEFPFSAYWYGIYCFPDAKQVIAVGFSNGDSELKNGAIITWSFDGGETWTERLPMPRSPRNTGLQSVHFYNNTHGIILPYQGNLAYYTTNGGRSAADWTAVVPESDVFWFQSHPISVFGDVTKTLARNYGDIPFLCSSDDGGKTWPACSSMNHQLIVGSFVSLNDGIGTGGQSVLSTHNGGTEWKEIGSYPSKVYLPRDMLWVPNSDIVILVGEEAVVQSMDRGVTWTESIPNLLPTSFRSVDSVKISETTTEVWAVGWSSVSAMILHATVTLGKVVS